MKDMITQFELFLVTEIKNMMLLKVGYRCTPSGQSQAALSGRSHENDDSINDIDLLGDEPTFGEESSVAASL